MREPSYFVLASLLDGPLNGYAIIRRAEHLSGGRVRLATGTLYTALERLTARGWRIAQTDDPPGSIARITTMTSLRLGSTRLSACGIEQPPSVALARSIAAAGIEDA